MSTELKLKEKRWRYTDLLEKYKSLLTKTADAYIPELFEALHEDYPKWTNKELENRLIKDLDGINKKSTILHYKAEFMKDKTAVHKGNLSASARKISVEKNSKERERQLIIETFNKAQEQLEPVVYHDNNETVGKGKPLEEWKEEHPTVELSSFQRVGDFNKGLEKLWQASTGLKKMPTTMDDVKADCIIPTRQFRKDFLKGSTQTERTYLHNWVIWVRMALNDTLEIIESIDGKQ